MGVRAGEEATPRVGRNCGGYKTQLGKGQDSHPWLDSWLG